MKRRTKIVATMGPAVASQERIRTLIAAGMNVARLNCSHGNWDEKERFVEWIRAESPEVGPIGIFADLQGPKFRLGELSEGGREFETGSTVTIGLDDQVDIPFRPDQVWAALRTGDRVLFGDGAVEIKILKKLDDRFEAKMTSGGEVKSRQGVTVVGRSFDGPSLTERDIQDVYEAARVGVDYIALSYVRRAADMRELRRLVDKYDPTIKLIAKIETKEALKDIDEILKLSDAIMVARGDLGLQMDIEDVPVAQKRIIAKANLAGIPVITATQMLESMMVAGRPTRAEASDVANAILDGTDAVMLSGETATGEFPIECVRTMSRIAEKAELTFEHSTAAKAAHEAGKETPTDAVAHAAVKIASTIAVRAIVTTSTSGKTPRLVSKYRPRVPILCASWNHRTYTQLSLVWGVQTVLCDVPGNTDESIAIAVDVFLRHRRLKPDELVVITAGIPAGEPGNTNLILVQRV